MFLPYDDVNPTDGTPVVNWTVIVLNILIFIGVYVVYLPSVSGQTELVQGWLEWANRQEGCLAQWKRMRIDNITNLFLVNYGLVPEIKSPVTFFTSMFLHGGLGHIAGNMLFLWITGDNIEDRFGHLGYVMVYLVCGLAAAIMQISADPSSCRPMIGASGAISGMLGAYIVLFPRSKIKIFYWVYFFIGRTRIPALVWIGLWFFMQVAFSQGGGSGGGVAYHAHIGGFIAGAAIAYTCMSMQIIQGGVRRSGWRRR